MTRLTERYYIETTAKAELEIFLRELTLISKLRTPFVHNRIVDEENISFLLEFIFNLWLRSLFFKALEKCMVQNWVLIRKSSDFVKYYYQGVYKNLAIKVFFPAVKNLMAITHMRLWSFWFPVSIFWQTSEQIIKALK